jgi:hypothetical protein
MEVLCAKDHELEVLRAFYETEIAKLNLKKIELGIGGEKSPAVKIESFSTQSPKVLQKFSNFAIEREETNVTDVENELQLAELHKSIITLPMAVPKTVEGELHTLETCKSEFIPSKRENSSDQQKWTRLKIDYQEFEKMKLDLHERTVLFEKNEQQSRFLLKQEKADNDRYNKTATEKLIKLQELLDDKEKDLNEREVALQNMSLELRKNEADALAIREQLKSEGEKLEYEKGCLMSQKSAFRTKRAKLAHARDVLQLKINEINEKVSWIFTVQKQLKRAGENFKRDQVATEDPASVSVEALV